MKKAKCVMLGLIITVVMPGFALSAQEDEVLIGHHNVAFHVSPDGQQIVFSAADGDLHLLNLRTKEVRRLTMTDDAVESTPFFAPDGSRVVYSARKKAKAPKGASIIVTSFDGKQTRKLTDTADVYDYSPSFSPDGRRIAFARAHRHRPYSLGGWTWDQFDVYTVNVDGTNVRRVTREHYYSMNCPVFSHDGESVIFSAHQDGDTNIFEVSQSGKLAPKILTDANPNKGKHGAWASRPSLSPDGKKVTFISDRLEPFHYDVFVMNREGTAPTPLGATKSGRYNTAPVFMPDGRSVLFLDDMGPLLGVRGPLYRLCQIGLDGKGWREIADSELFTNPKKWKPRTKE